jgi:predicted nucleic acid-binding protein
LPIATRVADELVLDCSAALAWIYQDENSATADKVLQCVTTDGAWAPSIWRLEVANGLRTGMRRGRISAEHRDQALTELGLFDITIDPDTEKYAWTTTLRLSDRLGLSPYDASYLELAQRRSLPLGSLDNALCTAARTLGVAVVGD